MSIKSLGLILFVSLFWWSVLLACGSAHGTLSPKWSDNVSNISAAWIFLHEGFRIYGQPISQFTEDRTLRDRLPKKWTLDLQDSQGEFFKNKYKQGQADYLVWSGAPRPYPFGAFLLFMPWAFLSYGLDLGYLVPVWALAFLLLFLANLSFFYFAREFLQIHPLPKFKLCRDKWYYSLKIFVLIVVYFESVQWVMEGQYQSLLLLPLTLFAKSCRQSLLVNALLYLSVAFFLHLHAILYLPVLAWFIYKLVHQKQTLHFKLTKERFFKIILSVCLILTSGYCLLKSFGPYTSGQLTYANPWFWKNWASLSFFKIATCAVGFLFAAAFLIWSRIYGAFILLLSAMGLFMISSHLKGWYIPTILPLFLLSFESPFKKLGLFAALVAYVFLAGTFLGNSPLQFYFIRCFF